MEPKCLVPNQNYETLAELFDGAGSTLCRPGETLIYRERIYGYPWGSTFEFAVMGELEKGKVEFLRTARLSRKQLVYIIEQKSK